MVTTDLLRYNKWYKISETKQYFLNNRAAFFSIYPYKTYSLSIFGRIYRTTDLEIFIYPTERNVRRFNEMTFLLPYRFCQCSSSLKFCVFPIFRLKQVICLTWLSKIYKVKHGQRKSLFKFYLKATCLLKLCIEGRTNMFYICFDAVFVTHYEYIYISNLL